MTNEWTKEIETLRARVAALEAARIEDHGQIAAAEGCIDALCDVLGIPGGARADRETAQSALDAVVSAAHQEGAALVYAEVVAMYEGAAVALLAQKTGSLPMALDKMPTSFAQMVALWAIAYLRETAAPNYGEWRLEAVERDGSRMPVIVTVQRVDGKTPHELRIAAEERVSAAVAAERARIRARVEAMPGAITVDDTILSSDSSPLVDRYGVFSAIGATEGGAP
jgi:hypothetical protein